MTLTRAWLALLILSALSTLLAISGLSGAVLAAGVLGLAFVKAQVILGHYLELVHAPFWRRGFSWVLALFMLGLFGLAAAG